MRNITAILFGTLLLLMQAMSAVVPIESGKAKVCACCDCGKRACCVESEAGIPAPIPVAAQRSASESQILLLPAFGHPDVSFPIESKLSTLLLHPAFPRAAVQPLFRQHCALLI